MSEAYAATARWTPANIGSVVAGFILFWPAGILILFYVLSGGDMARAFNRSREWVSNMFNRATATNETTGNSAFDAYREETMNRLKEEQRAFGDFMERLRRARDQEEFERFMAERRNSRPS